MQSKPVLTLDALERDLHHWMSQCDEGRKRLAELGVTPMVPAGKKTR